MPIKRVHVSYAEPNLTFAERLEADLKIRNLEITRTDPINSVGLSDSTRSKLMSSQAVLFVGSDASVSDRNVLQELEFAIAQHLPVIPMVLQPNLQMPFNLTLIQWINLSASHD